MKLVTKSRMWTPSMFRTVSCSGVGSRSRVLWKVAEVTQVSGRYQFPDDDYGDGSRKCLLAVLPDTPFSPTAVCLVAMRASD